MSTEYKVYSLATNPNAEHPTERFAVPVNGAMNPGDPNATTPGSFANAADIGGPLAFSSPDSPGMPAPSPYTAWDFLPEDWSVEVLDTHPKNGLVLLVKDGPEMQHSQLAPKVTHVFDGYICG